MKTRYFRRKENCAAVEWIEMSGAEYLNFVRNPKNKDRFFLNMKNVVLECSKEEYLQNRAEKRRSDYLAEGKKTGQSSHFLLRGTRKATEKKLSQTWKQMWKKKLYIPSHYKSCGRF